MKEIDFSYNWNNKLDCKAFTSLRLSDRFDVGEQVRVTLHHKKKFFAEVVDKRWILLDEINEYIARIDTGYSAEECKDILRKMYKGRNVDWSKQKIYHYLFKKVEYVDDSQMLFCDGNNENTDKSN